MRGRSGDAASAAGSEAPIGACAIGFEEIRSSRWSPASSSPVAREHGVGRAVPGPLVHAPGAAARGQLAAVVEDPVHARARDEAPERATDPAERLHRPLGHAVAPHQRDRVGVVGVHAQLDVGQERGELRGPRQLRARAPLQLPGQPHVVVVLVGQDDQLEVLDRHAVLGQALLEPGLGLLHQRPGVEQRQRRAAQQPGVDVADPERRRQCDPVDVVRRHLPPDPRWSASGGPRSRSPGRRP